MNDSLAVASELLHAACRSDPGCVREHNEDLPILDAPRGVFGVIDGVGGSAAGEVAAAVAREVILHRLSRPLGSPSERVREAIAISNNEIFKRSERAAELRGMTCVVTLAIVSGGRLTIGHVGDSRLYTLDPLGLRKLTHDHSPVGEREDAREITELEAMRHPRRNEVYRDVGSALHDKDDDDFVEVIETTWAPDQALLLCTDGLTDMVPSTTIERIVRRFAGRPEQVADALVDAANEAGGKDNVTVVYAEAPDFARAVRERATADSDPGGSPSRAGRAPWKPLRTAGQRVRTFARWVVRSRTTWFAAGALAGVLGALALAWQAGETDAQPSRTLAVGATMPGAYQTAAAALTAARPGDVVSLEPGVYAERILVPEGVSLVARLPRTATIRRAAGATGEWVSVTAVGALGGRLAGFRIESTAEAPIDVAVRLEGQGRVLEMLDVSGPIGTAIDLQAGSSVVLQGSVLEVPAVAVRVAEGAQARLAHNVISRVGRGRVAPIAVTGSAQVTAARNVFAGFGPVIVDGSSVPVDLSGNFLLGAQPGGAR